MEKLSYSSRCAVVVELAEKLRQRGSWCGETRLQKALFILQDLAKFDLGYKFIIYKHGHIPSILTQNFLLCDLLVSWILTFRVKGMAPVS